MCTCIRVHVCVNAATIRLSHLSWTEQLHISLNFTKTFLCCLWVVVTVTVTVTDWSCFWMTIKMIVNVANLSHKWPNDLFSDTEQLTWLLSCSFIPICKTYLPKVCYEACVCVYSWHKHRCLLVPTFRVYSDFLTAADWVQILFYCRVENSCHRMCDLKTDLGVQTQPGRHHISCCVSIPEVGQL